MLTEFGQAIERWLNYRIKPTAADVAARTNRKESPSLARLMNQLSGIDSAAPRARVAYQEYLHEEWDSIKVEVDKRWKARPAIPSNAKKTYPNVAYRADVARDLFLALKKEEQAPWIKLAAEKTVAEMEAYREALEAPISQTPEDRQE